MIDKPDCTFNFLEVDENTIVKIIDKFPCKTSSGPDSISMSSELNQISEWLKINKLSLNIKKNKFMVFHTPQKKISKPNIIIDNIALECVEKFNCLGVILHQNTIWKSHIDSISSKIGKSIGVLNRLKHCLPTSIKVLIYNSLILSRINYGILLWGYQSERIFKLQKKTL